MTSARQPRSQIVSTPMVIQESEGNHVYNIKGTSPSPDTHRNGNLGIEVPKPNHTGNQVKLSKITWELKQMTCDLPDVTDSPGL